MHTPTLDHQEHPEPGCLCNPVSLCPRCMGKLQAARHEWSLKRWVETWGNQRRPARRVRPFLRVVR